MHPVLGLTLQPSAFPGGFQQNQMLSTIPMDATGLLVVLEENHLGLRIATHGLQVHVHEGLGEDLES